MSSVILLIISLQFLVTIFAVQSNLNYTKDITSFFYQQLKKSLNFTVLSGYFPIDWYFPESTSTGLFFELFTQQGYSIQNSSQSQATIFWFNGGPGCSSQYGFLGENGPFYVDDSIKLQLRDSSWNKLANIVYIDQPLNVGFSYSDENITVNNTEVASQHIQNFMYHFFRKFYQLQQTPIYLFGESFAGTYIPQFAKDIINNPKLSFIKIKGIGLGNGWIDPITHTLGFSEFYYCIGIISSFQRYQYIEQEKLMLKYNKENDYNNTENIILNIDTDIGNYGNIDYYNYEHYFITEDEGYNYYYWLIEKSNQEALGVPDFIDYIDCNDNVFYTFKDEVNPPTAIYNIEYLLNFMHIVLFQGQLDITVVGPSQLRWIHKLRWLNIHKWNRQKRKIWKIDNQVSGTIKSYSNLTYVSIYGAGHMVPIDKPIQGLDLLQRTINWNWDQ